MIRSITIFLFAFLNGIVGIAQINFVNQSSTLGVNISAGNTEYGNGISFCDFNNDGWDDISLATQTGNQSEFFLNNQDGTYTRQNFTLSDNDVQGRQLIWVDYDNDGDKDLYIASNTDGSHLYNHDGAFNFTDVTASAGLPTGNIETWGASFGDINNDGFLDIFISNRDDNLVQPNLLFLNDQDGTFTDISVSAGIHTSSHLSFCSAFFDFNNDGLQDIYVANDKNFNENFLYRNNGDNTFTNVAPSASVNIAIDAMTTTVGDYNNDGWFDIYVTNTTFSDVTSITGTAFNSFAWGTVFLDADNDMDLDMYVSSSMDGSVPQLPSAAFYNNRGDETFEVLQAGFLNDNGISHANAIGDSDNDGYPEIVVGNSNNESINLWKNETVQDNNWLKLKLEGVISNKDAIGSKIEISISGEKQYRYTLCGEGYISQNSNTEFFGLGSNTIVDYVKVTWLSGSVDLVENVTSNQLLTIVEGAYPLNNEGFEFNNSILIMNPVENSLEIASSVIIDKIILYDMLGNVVLQESVNTNHGKFEVPFLHSGVYLIKVSSGKNYIFKRIVKR